MLSTLRENPFHFPRGRRAGFDPSHVANRGGGTVYSAIPASSNFINLQTGAIGVRANSPTAKILGSLGPAVTLTGTPQVTGTAYSTNINETTIAAIVRPTSVAAANANLLALSTAGTTGWLLRLDTSSLSLTAPGNQDRSFAFGLIANTPYFLAASGSAARTIGLALNLATGQLQTGSTTGGTARSTMNVSVLIGDTWSGEIGPLFASTVALSLAELMQWTADPWSFWYPQPFSLISSITRTSPFLKQSHFRFRSDAGAVDAVPTWGGTEDI